MFAICLLFFSRLISASSVLTIYTRIPENSDACDDYYQSMTPQLSVADYTIRTAVGYSFVQLTVQTFPSNGQAYYCFYGTECMLMTMSNNVIAVASFAELLNHCIYYLPNTNYLKLSFKEFTLKYD